MTYADNILVARTARRSSPTSSRRSARRGGGRTSRLPFVRSAWRWAFRRTWPGGEAAPPTNAPIITRRHLRARRRRVRDDHRHESIHVTHSAQATIAAHMTEHRARWTRLRMQRRPRSRNSSHAVSPSPRPDRPQSAQEIVQSLDALATPTGTCRFAAGSRALHSQTLGDAALLLGVDAAGIVVVVAATARASKSRARSRPHKVAVVPFENLTGDATLRRGREDHFPRGTYWLRLFTHGPRLGRRHLNRCCGDGGRAARRRDVAVPLLVRHKPVHRLPVVTETRSRLDQHPATVVDARTKGSCAPSMRRPDRRATR